MQVLVQTMGALMQDSCVLVPPYVRAKGRIVVSRGGGRWGRHGRLGLRFDSLEVRSGHWVPISGILDTLEYAKPGALTDSGLVSSGKTSVGGVGRKLLPAGVAAAADLDAIPVAVLGGFSLIRRGPPVRILGGEIGGIRLTEPLVLPSQDQCDPVATHRQLTEMPELPAFVPRSENRAGTMLGDPFNVLMLGTAVEIDSAFRAAGWLPAQKRSVLSITREVTAAISRRAAAAICWTTCAFPARSPRRGTSPAKESCRTAERPWYDCVPALRRRRPDRHAERSCPAGRRDSRPGRRALSCIARLAAPGAR